MSERGGHAHRKCHQVLIAVKGEVEIEYVDLLGSHLVTLNSASVALHIPPGVWAKQTYLDEDSSLLVLASDPYDVADYVDDIDEALALLESLPSFKEVS